jgi:hypothetical protein
MTGEQIKRLAIDAHTGLTPRQLELNEILRGPQRHTLFFGGARSGKTVLFVRSIISRAAQAPGSRHGMFRFRGNAARNSLCVAARNDGRPDARSRTISDAGSLRLKSAPDARSVRLSAN